MKTHRCEGSLKAGVSIRLNTYEYLSGDKKDKWELLINRYDSEWDCYHLDFVAEIKLCPFCGEVLN